MKKNGFTLIELMAVIIILAVILIMAIPEVNFIIRSNKEEVFIDNARLMAKAADSYFTLYLGKRPQEVDATAIVTLEELVSEDIMDMITDPLHNNVVCDDQQSYVIIRYEGNRKYNYYVTLNCNGYGLINVLSEELSVDKLGDL